MGRFLFVCLASTLLTPVSTAQTRLGDYLGHSASMDAVSVRTSSGTIRFVFYLPEIVRVDFLPDSTTALDSSFVVIRRPSTGVPFTLTESPTSLTLETPALRFICSKSPLRITYADGSGRVLISEGESGGFFRDGPGRGFRFRIEPDIHFYGTGERGTTLDKRGQAFESENVQTGGYTTALPSMNITVPFVATSKGVALYFENTYPGRFDFGASDQSMFSYVVSGGELSLFIFAAPTVPLQLEAYTWLTGRQPLPPRWAMGYLQSKFGYRNEGEARALVQTMRQKGIPCDAIVLDLYWFNQMGDLAWNSAAWPDPGGMIRDFLRQGVRTVVITEPYLTQYSNNFPEASVRGFLGKDSTGNPYILTNWWSCRCNAGLLDITNPVASEWWWGKHAVFLGLDSGAVAGLWTDLGEPERHPPGMVHFLGSRDKVHNIYNLLWARLLYEGMLSLRPDQRVFNLTRSGYAGIQRYGVIPWSGDVGRDFGGLAVQIPMLLGMGLSGLAYHNSDIGGFGPGTTTEELYTRWMQFGTFSPVTRVHGVGQDTEPWAFGPAAETIARSFIELRYRLLPYIATMAHRNTMTGMPLARPLFFEAPDDPNLVNESSAYMWGDAFLVSPVVQAGQTEKDVYLPGGTWIDFWTDTRHAGGKTIRVHAPLDRLPLFVRTGSIIPMQQVMRSSGGRTVDTLTLAIYPAPETAASFTLYEDDGQTLAYQRGEYAITPFVQTYTSAGARTSLTVTVGPTTGTYAGKPSGRFYILDLHGIDDGPAAVTCNDIPLPRAFSPADLQAMDTGFVFDEPSRRLFIHVSVPADSICVLRVDSVTLAEAAPGPASGPGVELEPNYPNPFNSATTISFFLPRRETVTLTVYDLLAREVRTLLNEVRLEGKQSVRFDARGLASGTYVYRLTAGNISKAHIMQILR